MVFSPCPLHYQRVVGKLNCNCRVAEAVKLDKKFRIIDNNIGSKS
jgi:hypothetical protein